MAITDLDQADIDVLDGNGGRPSPLALLAKKMLLGAKIQEIIDEVNDIVDGSSSFDTISELTSGSGVTIDGMRIKDKQIDVSNLLTGEAGLKLPANKTDGYSIYDSAGDILVIDTSTGAVRVKLPDNIGFLLGTGGDDLLAHDGTDTIWTHTTGDWIFDSTDVNDPVRFRLGTDTAATSFGVRNNSDADLFTVGGDGAVVIGGSLKVGGKLVLTGGSVLVDAEHVDMRANYSFANVDYVTAAAQTGGLVVNYLPTATADTTTGAGVVTAGVDGVSDPTITTVGAATFAATDLVMISGSANDGENDGLYEVQGHAANVLTLKSTSSGISNRVEAFTQDQLVANAGDTGMAITKVTITVIRAGTDGIWEVGSGSQTGITYADLVRQGDGAVINDGNLIFVKGAGTGTGDVVARLGATATEGLELRVYEETVNPAAVETNLINIPASSRIVSVQANVQSALTGGGTTATWSIGTAADPDKYGTAGFPVQADSLAQNSNSNFLGDGAVLDAAEQMVLTGTATGGAADGDTALTVGSVRVRVVYYALNTLDAA